MPVDPMFVIATSAFAWGLSLATYRWFALYNGWPMGEWQAHRPGLPIAIGLFAVLFAMLFAVARGGSTMMVVPLIGTLSAIVWTALTRVGAQSALLFAPIAVMVLLMMWITAASVTETGVAPSQTGAAPLAPVSERSPSPDPLRGIPTDRQAAPLPPPTPR